MTRRTWSVAWLMTLLLTAAAWGQSSFFNPTSAPASSDVSTATGDTSATTDLQSSIKQQLRSELAQLIVQEIHQIFQQIRTSFGLPAEPTDPTTDPLSILETAITTAVEAKLST
jgi:hypothetical protein